MLKVEEAHGVTEALSSFASSLAFEDLPSGVIDWTKYLFLDFVGVTIAGSRTPAAQTLINLIGRLGRLGPSVVIGTPHRALPEWAAMANGASSHGVEMSDTDTEGSVHPGEVIFPATLACADLATVDGKSLIVAAAVGYDVMIRLGRALKPQEHYFRGFHPTATCGAFGASAASARLLGLRGSSFAYALGIAGSQAAGSKEGLQNTWTKYFHPGWAAHSGLLAALLAREGLSGPTTIIEGKNGFLRAYSGDPNPDQVLMDLGEVFQVTRTGVKAYASCRYTHGPIDGILRLVRQNYLQPHDVESVTVGLVAVSYDLIATPPKVKWNPVTVEDLQVSMPFSAAMALLYRRQTPLENVPEMARRDDVRNIMARVRCVHDQSLEARFPRHWPSWVEIKTTDGRMLREEVEDCRGSVDNPLSWDELKAKFCELTGPVISVERQQQIIGAVEDLDEVKDIRDATCLMASE